MSTVSIPSPRVCDEVQAARAAQRKWAELTVRERLRPVRALRHLLVAESDRLCLAVQRDMGKSPEETLAGDILPLADGCRFLEREAPQLLSRRRVPRRLRPLWLWGQQDTVQRRPRGVVGIIGTWNYPLFLNGVQIVQALTAGNVVIWKPSEVSPASAELLHRSLLEAGFPNEVILLLEPSRESGAALLEADIDHLVFTGSAATGRRVASRLGERLISSTLELSGCDALFVLEDADLALAAQAAWFGSTLNRGQTCLAVRRAFVQRTVYVAFCEHLTRLSVGTRPVNLALPAQAEQAERLVQAALADGGRLLSPPKPTIVNEGTDLFQPAIVADAQPAMAVCREASFAPIMAVMGFDSLPQAVDMETTCGYALGASIFTRDRTRAADLAAQLRAGVVTVNDVIVPTAHPATPFGGHGDSGWGVTQGAEGLLEMTVPQVVSVRMDAYRPHYDLTEPGGAVAHGELVRGLLESSHAATLAQRWAGWRRLLRALWRGK